MNLFQAGVMEWGERSTPLPKQLIYVFSLDFRFFVEAAKMTETGGTAAVVRIMAPLEPAKPAKGSGFTYHVRDEVLVKSADGIVRDVPHGIVQYADDRMDVDGSGAGTLCGRALLAVDEGGSVSIEYTGVVTMTREVASTLRACKAGDEMPIGSAFISIRSASERVKYRWLTENQLFAFGRVNALCDADKVPHLLFSYDVYIAG